MWNIWFTFAIHFFICSIALFIFGALLFLLKRRMRNQLSPRSQYHLWFFFLIALALPLVPLNRTMLGGLTSTIRSLFPAQPSAAAPFSETSTSMKQIVSTGWMQDFTSSFSHQLPSALNLVILAAWFLGIVVMATFTLHASFKIIQLERQATPVASEGIRSLLERCKDEVGISRKISVYSIRQFHSPFIGGLLKPAIYIPTHYILASEDAHLYKELRFIFLHELQHYKNKDIWVNRAMSFFRIIYWFHPFVWYAMKAMKDDCEIACDASVLDTLGEAHYTEYGHTLIDCAERGFSPVPFFTANIGGSEKQIKKRILCIASYRQVSSPAKAKSICAFLLAATLTVSCAPFLSFGLAKDEYSIPDRNRTVFEDDSAYFEGYKGSVVLYDTAANRWTIYNREQSIKRVSPNSTYKIYSALFALESGVITEENSMLAWDGAEYPYESWNRDQNLKSAMKNSVTWYFQNLDEKTGIQAISRYLEDIHYGNEDFSGGTSRFWLESSLKISPVEQVSLLQKLYRNEFQFDPQNVEIVKNSMILASSEDKTLYGKTGTGSVEGKITNGWFIGFVEVSDHVVFFATNIQGDDAAYGSVAAEITLKILRDKEIYDI